MQTRSKTGQNRRYGGLGFRPRAPWSVLAASAMDAGLAQLGPAWGLGAVAHLPAHGGFEDVTCVVSVLILAEKNKLKHCSG